MSEHQNKQNECQNLHLNLIFTCTNCTLYNDILIARQLEPPLYKIGLMRYAIKRTNYRH